jgi:tetratricopeptide (TPR) repeat protein
MSPEAAKPNLREKLALVDRFLARGDLLAAEATARQLLAAYPRRGEANHRLGLVLARRGRPEHAEEFLRRAVEAEKADAGYRLELGQCLIAMGRVVEAEEHFARARALAPQSPRVNWQWGRYLLAIGRGEEALAAFDRALVTAPAGDQPAIHLDRLDGLLSLGRTEEAERDIRARLQTTPYRSRYLVLLSQIGKPDASSEVFGLIGKELARPGLSPMARSDLMLRQGSLLAQSGRHEEAFQSWTAAKKLLGAPPRGPELARIVDERISAFPAETIAHLSGLYGTPGPNPIFVIGLPRSGTTLVSEILAAHEQVGNAGEIETMTWVAARMRGSHPLSHMARALAEQGREKVRALAASYGKVAAHLVSPKQRSVDKMPNNFLYLAEIAILFPDARFIDCTRHPADTFISAIQTEMNDAHSYSYDARDFALYHQHHRRLMQHWKDVLPGRIFDLGYESLVTDPRRVVADLLGFLGLPWQEACLTPGANPSTVRTFSRLQVKSAIHAGSVGRWKPYAEWLGPMPGA